VRERRVVEVTSRLTYWTEPHPLWRPNPEWPEDVGCVLFRGSDVFVLIDPLVRDDLRANGWSWLDSEVERHGAPVVVLLTAPWHERSTRAVVERFAAAVWVHPAGRGRISDLPGLQTAPAGVEVFIPLGVEEGQAAFFVEGEQALVVGEFLSGTSGGLELCPSPATRDMDQFLASLRELESLSIERVLVGHGEPVLHDGGDAIASALESFTVVGA
jgi:glyoxylase-like metal-dependent hydrolase (beta-lactamase superfamily II)